MIYPHAKEYLSYLLRVKAKEAVEMRITEKDFIKDIYAFLRRTENRLDGLGDETTNNYEAFALFLGCAGIYFGRLEAIRRIKDGNTT